MTYVELSSSFAKLAMMLREAFWSENLKSYWEKSFLKSKIEKIKMLERHSFFGLISKF